MAKVSRIFIKNIKNIEYVDIETNGTLNYIAGNNGAGKTSVIEAIFQAMSLKEFAKADDARKLIKKGEKNGEISLVLEYKGDEVTVLRSFDRDKGVRVKISTASGVGIDQTLLNSWLGDFTIDPLAFSRMKTQEQLGVLKSIAGINTDEIDRQIQEAYEERTHKSRLERELRALVEKHSDVKKVVERKSVQELTDKLKETKEYNSSIDMARVARNNATQTIAANHDQIEQLKKRITQLEYEIVQAEETLKNANQVADLEKRDTTELEQQISDIESYNAEAYKWEKYQEDVQKHEKAKKDAEGMDDLVEELRQKRVQMFVEAGLPINGLAFDEDGGILIGGVPFHQLSTGEQIKISTELATHDKPELRVLYIQDGSLLDDESMAVIAKISEERDYQIFVELVGESQPHKNVVVLRQGKVLDDATVGE